MENLSAKKTSSDQKKKAALLKVILIVCIVLIPILAFLEVKKGDVSNAITEVVFVIPLLIGLIALRKNNYRVASDILIISGYCLTGLLSFVVKETGPVLVYRNCTYHLLALAIGITFAERYRIAFIGAIGMVFVQIIFAFGFLIPAGFAFGAVVTMLVMELALYGLICVLFLGFVSVHKKAINELEEEKTASVAQVEHISKLIEGSSANFKAISELSDEVASINTIINESVQSVKDIDVQVEKIDSGADSTLAATSQIGATIVDFNKSIAQMVSSQQESSASVTEMVAAVTQVAVSTEKEKGILDSLTTNSQSGRQQLQELFENIRNVEESLSEIYGMLGAIDNIATQTNLLAMNAAIEAAHAGTAGKGFAVVAEEIRKLADNSAKNSHEISVHLEKVTECIKNVSEQSTKTNVSFGEIEKKINESVLSFEQIVTATDELRVNGKHVLDAMSVLEDNAGLLKEGGASIQAAQKHLNENQANLKNSLRELSRETHNVSEKNTDVITALERISKVSEAGKAQAEALEKLSK